VPRVRRPFKRKTGLRDATLFVLATEGVCTEPEYFLGLREHLHSSRVHIEVLERPSPSFSAPQHVLRVLDEFRRKYEIASGDQLWMVIDRDSHSWTAKALGTVCRECRQKNYQVAMSNPCFEVWLILHFEDISSLGLGEKHLICMNRQGYLKKRVRGLTCAQVEAYFDHFATRITTAIDHAKRLDGAATGRWPSAPGTRVYQLVEAILQTV